MEFPATVLGLPGKCQRASPCARRGLWRCELIPHWQEYGMLPASGLRANSRSSNSAGTPPRKDQRSLFAGDIVREALELQDCPRPPPGPRERPEEPLALPLQLGRTAGATIRAPSPTTALTRSPSIPIPFSGSPRCLPSPMPGESVRETLTREAHR